MQTTTAHLRLALYRIPRPDRCWGRNAPPVVWQWQQDAEALLTRDYLKREYLQNGKTLRQISAETGYPRTFIARQARRHGIPITKATSPLPIDPDWLREQYLTRCRSYTDIAAELGTLDVTVIAAARRHGIPSRPRGVRSRPEMLTTFGPDVPRDIRRAIEGSLRGWQRLHRYQQAMTHPTIGAAARHLRIHQSVLVTQFRRLERDIGAPLYHRSAPRQPMRPTRRGTAVLQALSRPDIQALELHSEGKAGSASQ